MKNIKYSYIPLLIFLGLCSVFLYKFLYGNDELPSALLNKKVNDFSIPLLYNNDDFLSNSDLKGDVSVVNFFASWCLPCDVEHENIKKLSSIVNVYGIAWNDKPEDTKKWLESKGNKYMKVGTDLSGKAAINFGVYGMPETYIINKSGVIVYKYVGPISDDDLANNIIPLINSLKAE